MDIGWMIGSKNSILLVADLLNDKYVIHPNRF